jgi:hypothetical protein
VAGDKDSMNNLPEKAKQQIVIIFKLIEKQIVPILNEKNVTSIHEGWK